jgi:predicted regulator of Ras-like GTPase activity (Roadblock/LC7/MglB family)
MDPRQHEAPRDQADSAFTAILRRLWEQLPSLQAAAFVDVEGECIDYISRIDPYEAKVSAAHMHMLLGEVAQSFEKLDAGRTFSIEIDAADREIWVQRVGDDYVLVVAFATGSERAQREAAIVLACAEFRAEVGLQPPPWETARQRLSVRVRPATGWTYAPETYSDGGVRIAITDVIGRWTEAGGVLGDELVCFRVRTAEGRELTLVHDPDGDGWVARET